MKVTINKTFVDENGISVLKGRLLEVTPERAKELEAKGVIGVAEEKPKKSKK